MGRGRVVIALVPPLKEDQSVLKPNRRECMQGALATMAAGAVFSFSGADPRPQREEKSGSKIESIETIALYPDSVVRVRTAEGIEGIGQVQCPPLVCNAIVKNSEGLENILRGEDPFEVDRLWQKMYNRTSLWGRRGVTIQVIGAVETALWDIAGKILRKPVSELIWRPFAAPGVESEIKSKVRPYTTVYPAGSTDEKTRRRLRVARDRGFRGIKFEEWPGGFGHGTVKQDVRCFQLAREAIGEDRDLFADVQNAWTDVNHGIATSKAIEPLNVYLVEAPFAPDNLEAYRRLADKVDVRIAAGDWGYTTRFDFLDLMERGGVDVVEPSTVEAGGISEIMNIAEMAWRRGRLCIPHSWNHMIGVSAAVHIAAVVPNMPYFEFPTEFPERPEVMELLVPSLRPDADGMIEVPKRPGLGFTLNEDIVKKYRRNLS